MQEEQRIHFGLGGTVTRTMTENFREMKVGCNRILMNIFIEKVITDSQEMFLYYNIIDKVNYFQTKRRENYQMRIPQILAPLGLNVENPV